MTKLHSMRGQPHSQQEPVIENIVKWTKGKRICKERNTCLSQWSCVYLLWY